MRQVALDRGSMARYQEITEGLEATLMGLVGGGRFGTIFSEPTSVPMRRDRPVVFDVSSIDDSEMDLQAAVLLACRCSPSPSGWWREPDCRPATCSSRSARGSSPW